MKAAQNLNLKIWSLQEFLPWSNVELVQILYLDENL